jgi:hypothetical protein
VSELRPELARIVEEILRDTAPGDAIQLDAIGEAIGARAVSQGEIDAMLSAIEASGRHVATPEGGRGEANLKVVVEVARALRQELGRAPRPAEIAARAGMSTAHVQHALALAKVMQR